MPFGGVLTGENSINIEGYSTTINADIGIYIENNSTTDTFLNIESETGNTIQYGYNSDNRSQNYGLLIVDGKINLTAKNGNNKIYTNNDNDDEIISVRGGEVIINGKNNYFNGHNRGISGDVSPKELFEEKIEICAVENNEIGSFIEKDPAICNKGSVDIFLGSFNFQTVNS